METVQEPKHLYWLSRGAPKIAVTISVTNIFYISLKYGHNLPFISQVVVLNNGQKSFVFFLKHYAVAVTLTKCEDTHLLPVNKTRNITLLATAVAGVEAFKMIK